MRKIAHLPNAAQARTFGDFLFVQKIQNTVEAEADGTWAIWVHDDDQLTEAAQWLSDFLKDPANPRFQGVTMRAKFEKVRQKREEIFSRNQRIDMRTHFHLNQVRLGRLTLFLIIVSVAVALLSRLGSDQTMLQSLFISPYQMTGPYVQWRGDFPEVMNGQVWRLITPIFIHFGLIHLIFNMLWLRDLGTMIEYHQSSWVLGGLVLVTGVLSNVGQYLVSGPMFGGMSGVVYGLLGYIWIRGKYDPGSGLFLHRTIVIWMIVWFGICLTGLIGNVANIAHGVGLLIGIAWGFLSSLPKILRK
jgi:rhomboid protease GlpG